jgi:hypothetical protein
MKKYRIVEVQRKKLSDNKSCVVDFIPEILIEKYYTVDKKVGLFGKWKVCCEFSSYLAAKKYFLLKKEGEITRKVILK